MRFNLYTFVTMALALLAADVCHGASAARVDKKTTTSLIDKKTAAAIGLTRPHTAKGDWRDAAYGKKGKPDTPQGPHALPNADFARNITAVSLALSHRGPGFQPDFGKNVSAGNALFVPSQASNPGPVVKRWVGTPIVKTALPPAFNVVGGTVMKHPTSMLAAIGGATTGKRSGEVNGTSIRAKQH
ncbi:MAG: hypothetical protein ACLPID_17070 [Beijerinckiaceae bacterium]